MTTESTCRSAIAAASPGAQTELIRRNLRAINSICAQLWLDWRNGDLGEYSVYRASEDRGWRVRIERVVGSTFKTLWAPPTGPCLADLGLCEQAFALLAGGVALLYCGHGPDASPIYTLPQPPRGGYLQDEQGQSVYWEFWWDWNTFLPQVFAREDGGHVWLETAALEAVR